MKTQKIIVSGRVQGVFFRKSTALVAEELGIKGSVRNRADGCSVEIIATGDLHQLNQLTNWCKRGPAGAAVADVEITEQPLQQFEKFAIL